MAARLPSIYPFGPTPLIAVSSFGGFRTPAPGAVAPSSWSRHPKTFTEAVIHRPVIRGRLAGGRVDCDPINPAPPTGRRPSRGRATALSGHGFSKYRHEFPPLRCAVGLQP